MILLPYTDYSTPTEKVLLEILSVFEQLKENTSIVLDFQEGETIHPFFLTAIAFYLKTSKQNYELRNVSDILASVLRQTGFIKNIEFKNNILPQDLLVENTDSDYIPICKFEKNYENIDKLESELKKELLSRLKYHNLTYDFKTAIAYLISELIDNIIEHSKSSHGLIYLDYSDHKNLYIGIADNGITILGSYLSQQNPDPRILVGLTNIQSLTYSLNGVSTKNNRETHRGYGLSTNLDIVSNGLNGEFILISGDSLFLRNKNKDTLINLPENLGWDGTFIMVKIPLEKHENFKYLKYIE